MPGYAGSRRNPVTRSERLFPNPQALLKQGLGLGKALLLPIEHPEVVEARCNLGIAWFELLLVNREATLIERLRGDVAALGLVQRR